MKKISPDMSVADFISYTIPSMRQKPTKRIVTNIIRNFYTRFCSRPDVNNDGDVTLAMALSVSKQELSQSRGWGSIADIWWNTFLEYYYLDSAMPDFRISQRFSELNDTAIDSTDGDDFPELTTDICLRFLLASGYMVSISPQPYKALDPHPSVPYVNPNL